MRKGRIVIMVISGLILIAFLVIFDYSNIKSRPNLGYLLGMLSAAFNILAMILSNRYERKQQLKDAANRCTKIWKRNEPAFFQIK